MQVEYRHIINYTFVRENKTHSPDCIKLHKLTLVLYRYPSKQVFVTLFAFLGTKCAVAAQKQGPFPSGTRVYVRPASPRAQCESGIRVQLCNNVTRAHNCVCNKCVHKACVTHAHARVHQTIVLKDIITPLLLTLLACTHIVYSVSRTCTYVTLRICCRRHNHHYNGNPPCPRQSCRASEVR